MPVRLDGRQIVPCGGLPTPFTGNKGTHYSPPCGLRLARHHPERPRRPSPALVWAEHSTLSRRGDVLAELLQEQIPARLA
jgi:hypothetical protein